MKYDPVLCEQLLRIQLGNKFATFYLSPTIQKDFMEILGDNKQNDQASKETKYFSMAFDSTLDVSRKDQTSQILHYVMIDGDKVTVVASFVNFIETKGKSAENISKIILKKLEKDRNDIQNYRGQAYENAAVMAGLRTGVQKRIKEINEKAELVACTNHSLNLAGFHAASVGVDSLFWMCGTVA